MRGATAARYERTAAKRKPSLPPGAERSGLKREAGINGAPPTTWAPYSYSEVIHQSGDGSPFPASERERPQIVNNFAPSASLGYESGPGSAMNDGRISNRTAVLEGVTNPQIRTSLHRLRLPIRSSLFPQAARSHPSNPPYPMNPSTPEPPPLAAAAFVGIDWADQKHDVVLRSAAEPTKVEHQVLAHEVNALLDWINHLQQRFGSKGKVLVCL